MSSFMQLWISKKGALYACDCAKCGTTMYTQEWANGDHNDRRDAMQAGTLRCDECHGVVDADTFMQCKRSYAGRYAAPGYMDCTDWHYGTNLRALARELDEMYGDDE